MKASITKGIIILLAILAGFELTSFSQCVAEENVYSFFYMGKKYEVVKEQKTWTEAAACAVERGGYLAEIESQEEQDTVYSAIVNGAEVPIDYTTVNDGGGIAYIWIGASDGNEEGTWLWDGDGDSIGINFWNGEGAAGSDIGSPVDELYNNWGGSFTGNSNEPDDFGVGQDGAAIGLAKWPAGISLTLGNASEWNDIHSDNSLFFVIEYECQETSNSMDEIACDSFLSPSENVWTATGTYQDTIPNVAGCDSVITINLTILTVDTLVVQDGYTLTANATGAEYQWLNCDQSNSPIDGATDQSFVASSNGNYALEITESGCVDTSACYAVTTVLVNEKPFNEQLNIYQGTQKNMFYIDLGGLHQEVVLKVFDINGRLMQHRTFLKSQLLGVEIDSPPGLYFFMITSDTEHAVVKTIKN